MFQTFKKLVQIFSYITIFISILIFCTANWIINNFNGVVFEQLWFHINVRDYNPNHEYILKLITKSLIFSSIVVILLIILSTNFYKPNKLFLYIRIFKLKNKFQLYPIVFLKNYRNISIFSFITLTISIWFFATHIKVNNIYNYFFKETDFYNEEYINPKNVDIKIPKNSNNLILIYLESIESTMQSKKEGGCFDTNLIPELTKLANENLNFSATENVGGGIQVSFTGWTIAAMVSSNSGLPLKIPLKGNDISTYESFLPGVITLGDILEKNGYTQLLIQGSDSNYSGMKKFFQFHGNFKIVDYIYFKEKQMIPKDYFVWWGIEDSKLFEFSKHEINRLSQKKKPFSVIINTLNTHFSNGYLESEAKILYKEQYANVISYSSKQIYDFIKWIQAQPFYENTTIVLLGDHLSMDEKFFNKIKCQRYPYNCIINSRKKPIQSKNRKFTTYDWFPTIIESIGGEIKAKGLGFGRSLYNDQKTLIEIMGKDSLEAELNKNSNLYESFWSKNNFY